MLDLENMKKSEIKGAVAGMLLGRGHMFIRQNSIMVTSGPTEWTRMKGEILSNITGVEVKFYETRTGLTAHTNSHKYFDSFFWTQTPEITVEDLSSSLSDLGVAIWLLDLGETRLKVNQRKGVISKREFNWHLKNDTLRNLIVARGFMLSQYGIRFEIREAESSFGADRGYLRTATTEDLQRLVTFLAPYTPKCFRHKLDLKYKTDKNLISEYKTFLKNLPPDFFQGEDVL